MPFTVERGSSESGIEILTLSGRLTLGRELQHLEWTVEEVIKAQKSRVVFDLAGVSFIDSAGVGILIGCHGSLANASGGLRLAAVNDRVGAVLSVTRVDSILSLHPSTDDAVKAFG
ncbi:MAG: STAS domain-containing protein [Acidobacteria bacterium]|nr:STAS domain-containing protein [Acidobacteriota bacterium]